MVFSYLILLESRFLKSGHLQPTGGWSYPTACTKVPPGFSGEGSQPFLQVVQAASSTTAPPHASEGQKATHIQTPEVLC